MRNKLHGVKAKHGIFCFQCMKHKIQYHTQCAAEHALEYNNGDIKRIYYCNTCFCWHTTSTEYHVSEYEQILQYIQKEYLAA